MGNQLQGRGPSHTWLLDPPSPAPCVRVSAATAEPRRERGSADEGGGQAAARVRGDRAACLARSANGGAASPTARAAPSFFGRDHHEHPTEHECSRWNPSD